MVPSYYYYAVWPVARGVWTSSKSKMPHHCNAYQPTFLFGLFGNKKNGTGKDAAQSRTERNIVWAKVGMMIHYYAILYLPSYWHSCVEEKLY